MSKKISLMEIGKTASAFGVISATGIDALLLAGNRVGFVEVEPGWYLTGPLLAWGVASIPLSINLLERLSNQINARRGQIVGYRAGAGPGLRAIPMNINGQRRSLLTSTVQSIFGEGLPTVEEGRVMAPAAWRVPMDDIDVTISETELDNFLTAAAKRDKHQFSRRYWCERRRPALERVRYDALMRLLVEAGLVTGRHEQGGASGRLVTKPRHALAFLKNESAFAV